MENAWFVLAFALLAAISFLRKSRSPKKNPPPGPKPWPIIGSLHLLGSNPHRALDSLAKKYGDIMQLKFGSFPAVVASSPQMAEQFLKVHDANFASRPVTAAERDAFGTYRPCISRTVLSNKYLEQSNSGGPTVTMEELAELIDKWFWLNGMFNIRDWISWLSRFDLQGYVKMMKDLNKRFDKFFNLVLGDHKAKMESEEEFVPKDMVDVLLHLARDPNLEIKLTGDCVKGLMQDFLLKDLLTSQHKH